MTNFNILSWTVMMIMILHAKYSKVIIYGIRIIFVNVVEMKAYAFTLANTTSTSICRNQPRALFG
ncbi:hypothetical protein C7293_00705 [filamentous cyanobacterium CCT1]|nr:hypothetical protein C7293_00705 [filamentous cyanobacterium CCT1]PSN78087.1 hypothetical protein C8B47_18680 [filamentous cyanobacterium CCP4]